MTKAPADPAAREEWLRELIPLRDFFVARRGQLVSQLACDLAAGLEPMSETATWLAECQACLAAVEAVEQERCEAALRRDYERG